MAERLVVRTSLFKIPVLLLTALAFVALGVWGTQSDQGWIRWSAVTFFAAAAIYMAFSFFDDRAQLVISPEGLLMRRWSDATIPWTAIARCTVEKQDLGDFVYRRHICIYLHDPSLYPPSTRRGRVFGRGWNLGFGDITMATGGLDQDIPELMAAIRKYAVPAGVEVTE